MTRIVPSAALALALIAQALPGEAQTGLNSPAPGLGGTAASGAPGVPAAPRENFGATDVPSTDIIRELAPIGEQAGRLRVVETPSGTVTTDAARAIDLTVFFAYDSDRLLPEALPQLDALAAALNAPELRPYGFLIAGHTDAAGSAAYNLDLSQRRAISVARYLVERWGVDPARLVAHGWGEQYLALPSDPLSGANRRVEVSLLVERTGALRPAHRYQRAAWRPEAGHAIARWRLVDPRWRLGADALDDFHATPTWRRF